ncbi:MAG: hypothetical protein Q9159_002490 [Coniocarpon cinnabarinum]
MNPPSTSSTQTEKRKADQDGRPFSEGKTSKRRKTSTYDAAFEQHLLDYGVYPEGYDEDARESRKEARPANLDDIKEALKKRRPSLSPSRFGHTEHVAFNQRDRNAHVEMDITKNVFPTITGENIIPSSGHVEFNNLAPLTDGSIAYCKPDHYEGSRPTELDLAIRHRLHQFIIPSNNTSRPCLPNFFTELKGPSGTTEVAELQACYDGAMGARAVYQLRSYVDDETALDGKAYTITSTYMGGKGAGILQMYVSHPAHSGNPERPINYHMTQIGGWVIRLSATTFREGVTAFRNAREWALRQRKGLIESANQVAKSTQPPPNLAASEKSTEINLAQSATGQALDSETADERAN